MTPWLDDGDLRLYHGDALETVREMPDDSVDCVVTSPPYWGLRDYGTGEWDGGDPDCDHQTPKQPDRKFTNGRGENEGYAGTNLKSWTDRDGSTFKDECGKCGATRVDRQMGLEPTPDLFVRGMVELFREIRRVLAPHGTCWVNLGDSYNANTGRGFDTNQDGDKNGKKSGAALGQRMAWGKPKDLVGIPWRVAFALQQPYYAGRIKQERDRVWLAAMVEAEGCMFIHRRKGGTPNYSTYTRKDGTTKSYDRKQDTFGAGLEVASTDRVMVERCLSITGVGSISEQSPTQNARRKQTIYRWNVRSNECRWIVRELYPHMIAKQHEARLLLGCPSSGDDARKSWESLKALHQGQTASMDFPPPEGMWERGWFLRSDVIWAKLFPTPCPNQSPTGRRKHTSTYFC